MREAQRLRAVRGTAAPLGVRALLMQRRPLWFCHAAICPIGELIKALILLTLPRTWRRRTGGQLKMCATTVNADLEHRSESRVIGYARWRKDFVKAPSELAQVSMSVTWPNRLVKPA